jgi:hypothetical protein
MRIKFCARLNKMGIKTYEMFKIKNQDAMSCTQILSSSVALKVGTHQ